MLVRYLAVALSWLMLCSLDSPSDIGLVDNGFEVDFLGQDAALCVGQCVDFEIVITAGTGPFDLMFMNGPAFFSVDNYEASEQFLSCLLYTSPSPRDS